MSNPFILLQSIINQDQPDVCLPLLEDLQLVAVVNAWARLHVTWEPPDNIDEVPFSDYDLWDMLWEFSQWSLDDLSLAAGVTDATAMRCFNRAKMHRLIYPDGRISNSSRRVIALMIGSTLGAMAERAAGISHKSSSSKNDGQLPPR